MLRPFPTAGEPDFAAEQDVDWIKNIIQGVRRIRAELNLPPAQMLEALFQGGGPSDRKRQEIYAGTLAQLARIRSAKWVGEDAETAECAVALVGDLKVLIPLKGLVDVDEELARLNRQLERETAELRKSENKLGNSRFVENAPAAVVEQERERLAAYRGTVEKLHAQIRQLESLRA
jgi:valyl-tRNA synthetase